MNTIEERIPGMSEAELDKLPLGIIRLDRNGKILYYNASQAELAQRKASTTIGLNFFREVAPCTAVRDFQGRFNDFVASPAGPIKPFDFVFKFPWGMRKVTITLVRSSQADDSYYIVVAVAATAG